MGGQTSSRLPQSPEVMEKGQQNAADSAATKKEFQQEWTTPASELTAAQPEVRAPLKAQVLALAHQVPIIKDWSAQLAPKV